MGRWHHVCAAALVCALLGLVLAPATGAFSSAPPLQTCSNVILNGGFETVGNWALGPGPLAPVRVGSSVYSGSFAMQLGSPGPTNQVAYSWIYQRITIPNDAVSADLSFYVWLTSAAGAGADVQQALLMIPGSTDLSQPFQVLWSTQANAPAWQKIPVPLIGQKGRALDLYFNVFNDGAGGNTAMVLDNVTLTICQPAATPSPLPSVTPWPTPIPSSLPSATPFPTPVSSPLPGATSSPTPGATPFPTPGGSVTPAPSNCEELIRDGGFETGGAWRVGNDPLVPYYNNNAAFVHSGARSMALGAVNQTAVATPAFSSIRQDVALPAWAESLAITFWYYPLSNAAPNGFNRQELILLDPLAFDETVEVLWRVTENGQQWLSSSSLDLTAYRGRTLSVYFNARNAGDGKWTGMYLDDVSLLACGGAAVAVPLPFDTPTVVPEMVPEGLTQPGVALIPGTQQTVISVAPVSTSEQPEPVDLTGEKSDEPRSESRSVFDRLGDGPSDLAMLIGLGVAVLVIFAVVYWLWRRRSNKNAVKKTAETGDSSQQS